MSIKLMSAIFDTEFRDLPYTKDGEERKAKASTCKLLLLAIADHANDYGESAYPGYDKLETKTALSRQGISDTLQALVQNGIILIGENPSRLGTNNYTIVISSFPSLSNQIIDESSHLTQPSQATRLAGVKPLDQNHHLTTNESSGHLKTDELQGDYIAEADKTVDAILEAERNAHEADKQGKAWRGRELVMDAYLPYGDWWHKKTGLHMYAAKAKPKANSSWIKEFQAWWENDLTTEVLELAFQTEVAWRGVITHPRELTAKAIALSVNPNPMPTKNQPPVSNVKRSTTVQYEDDGTPINY